MYFSSSVVPGQQLEIETTFKFECEKMQYTKFEWFIFILKNIFIDHGDVKAPAQWFSEQEKIHAWKAT